MALFNKQKINSTGKLQHMIADDLFSDDLAQVFSAKTGKYLGVVKQGQEIDFQEQIEALENHREPENKQQLSLF